MDLESIKNQVSNLTLYDLKAGVRKVQNVVMNYTEMEAKVREATNNEPWGASSTMMQEIANGANKGESQLLNEIMPMIYKRFTEKSAEEWRQIYKALQLMEFLIKNGSERVIDDARSHLSLLKMLRQFHYIDQNGKDQGLNVRNRSKELTDLLSDVEKIRSERKKARTTKNKYGGVAGGPGIGGGMSSGSRYGGFGSEDQGGQGGYGGFSGGVYGDGGGFGGQGDMDYQEGGSSSRGRDQFEEYDEYDDGGAQVRPARRKADTAATSASSKRTPKKADAPKPKEPEVDLFEFGDDEPPFSTSPIAAPPSNGKVPAMPAEDDEFDDFQAAPAPSTTTSAPSLLKPNYSSMLTPVSTSTTTHPTYLAQAAPQSSAQNAGVSNIFSTVSPPPSSTGTPSQTSAFSPPASQQSKPTGYQPTGPNYFTSVPIVSATAGPGATPLSFTPPIGAHPSAKKPAAGGDVFANLLAGPGMKKSAPPNKSLTIADMAKQKTAAGLWGAAPSPAPPLNGTGVQKPIGGTGSSGMDDLLG